jgi:uncharacterized small protein (DUF1192 family)
MKTYIKLRSGEEIKGEMSFCLVYDDANYVQRIDLLNDWIALLEAEMSKQKAESREFYARIKNADETLKAHTRKTIAKNRYSINGIRRTGGKS